MPKTILIAEDDSDIREFVAKLLLDSGYSVVSVGDGVAALNLIEKKHPDLVIVDLGLPKLSGESVVTEIRKKHPDVEVIILTARGASSDVVRGFELGADDYIPKPFEADVLLARVKARLKSKTKEEGSRLRVADLELDTKTYEVKRGATPISLSSREFQLLEYLMANKGRVLTRDMILQRIWLTTDYVEPRVVDVYIGYLRRKIDGSAPKKLLHTMRGFGYSIKE